MGANKTQAVAVTALFVSSVVIAAGLAEGGFLPVLVGLALMALSGGLFLKCKPWEHIE